MHARRPPCPQRGNRQVSVLPDEVQVIAAPTPDPAAAEVITCAIGAATFPAAHTPGVAVSPVGSAGR